MILELVGRRTITVLCLVLSLAAGLASGTVVALATLHWGSAFILWQLVWWSFVSFILWQITSRLAESAIRDNPGDLRLPIPGGLSDAYLNQLIGITVCSQIIGVIALLVGLSTSTWAMLNGHVASAPVELYWPLPIGIFLLTAFSPVNAKLTNISDERKRARDQRTLEERERSKRCAEATTSLQRVEFENQFLQALYFTTAGDTGSVALGDVWSRLNHECAPELTMHAIKVWRERKCIDVGDQFNVHNKRSYLSLTAAGRDLCMRAIILDSMQDALNERSEGYRVKNEIHAQNAQIFGDHAHVHDNEFAQFVNTTNQVQLDKLAQELASLRRELLKIATSAQGHVEIDGVSEAEVAIAIGEVGNAEKKASKGDPQGVWEHLAKVGRWVLDVAKQMGISVAVETINAVFKHYNIPLSLVLRLPPTLSTA